MTPFIVLTMARSGSHHLQYLLNLHAQIKMRGELLNQTFETETDEHLIGRAFNGRRRYAAVGWKILQGQIAGRPLTLARLIETTPGLKLIVLERRNQLERLRSEAQADLTRRWAVDAPPPEQLPAVTLNPPHVHYWLRTADAWHRQLRELNPLWITYEDLMADQTAAMAPAWPYLGVDDPGPLDAQTYRQEHRPLDATITNLPELQQFLADTPYQQSV